MNQTLRKLLRDPGRFLLDNAKLRPILRRVGLLTKSPSGAGNADPAAPGRYELAPTTELNLIGENWRDAESRKPVAVMWGVPEEKRDFISRYLADRRTAYVQNGAWWAAQESALDQHNPQSVIAWGAREPRQVKAYARRRRIPIHRMAEGFIRPVQHGARPPAVLSLVFGRQGIYFDASRPSDLERLLNEHDFNAEPRLMRATGPLLRVMRGLRVGLHNPITLHTAATLLGPKLGRRVLVIGQAKEDASVRYGLAQDWTDRRLIELARAENPGAEIVYKPPGKLARILRTDLSRQRELQELCRVLVDEVVLADLLELVDHVYTITSHAGFEALVHGLPVTVVGMPFYAGWGLTDDRAANSRRTRRLTLEELFCGAYLLYSHYLTDPKDPVTGCLAAMLRVASDRKQGLNRLVSTKTIESLAEQVAASEHWPVLLKHEKLLPLLPLEAIFARCQRHSYQRSMTYLLAGVLRKTLAFESFLTQLRDSVQRQHFSALLADLWRLAPSQTLLPHKAWLAEGGGEGLGGDDVVNPNEEEPTLPLTDYVTVLAAARFELARKDFAKAYRLFNLLLLSGYIQGDVIGGIAEIAELRFDFISAARLLEFHNQYDPIWKGGRGYLREGRAQALAGNAPAALAAMAMACDLTPRHVAGVVDPDGIGYVLVREIGDLPYAVAMVAARELKGGGNPIDWAKALIACGRAAEAERRLLTYAPPAEKMLEYGLTLSRAYANHGKPDAAKEAVTRLLLSYPTFSVYREGLRLAAVSNDHAWGYQLLAGAAARGFDAEETTERRIRLAANDLQGAFNTYRNSSFSKLLRAYCRDSNLQPPEPGSSAHGADVLVVAYGGLGDEIRHASLYREMRERFPSSKVTFTCDPRLLPLLQRHYTDLSFLPVTRVRSLARIGDSKSYDQLPGSDLCTLLDNAGWSIARNVGRVILTSDLLGEVIQDCSSFKGTPYLKCDPDRAAHWRSRLSNWADTHLVGINWRSSVLSQRRNEHYLTVEELAPLFGCTHIRFVNLQYGDCAGELAWLEARFPGRIIDFADLDQYNDLDGVAALMSCLDLIVGPATTPFQLAGALGLPTLFFCNSPEHLWRKLPGTMTDAWHHSAIHVMSRPLGDKAALVRALTDSLSRRFPLVDNGMGASV